MTRNSVKAQDRFRKWYPGWDVVFKWSRGFTLYTWQLNNCIVAEAKDPFVTGAEY